MTNRRTILIPLPVINRRTVADALYTAYCQAAGGKAFNGDPLPAWKEFEADPTKQKQVEAWLATADRAMQLFRD